jgi:hypothetical protein
VLRQHFFNYTFAPARHVGGFAGVTTQRTATQLSGTSCAMHNEEFMALREIDVSVLEVDTLKDDSNYQFRAAARRLFGRISRDVLDSCLSRGGSESGRVIASTNVLTSGKYEDRSAERQANYNPKI